MLGFIVAFFAGFLTPHAEGPLARPVAKALSGHVDIAEGELRLLSFALMMVVAGVVCAVFDSGSPLGVTIAGLLGYFALRLLNALQRLLESRR